MAFYEQTIVAKQDLPGEELKKVEDKYKEIIEKNSGKILSSVNKKLNFLIVGDKPTTKKVNQAKDLNIKIINRDGFNKLLN